MDRGNKRPRGQVQGQDPRSHISMDDYLMERKVQSLYFDRITEDELAPKDSALKLALIATAKKAKTKAALAAKNSHTKLKAVSKTKLKKANPVNDHNTKDIKSRFAVSTKSSGKSMADIRSKKRNFALTRKQKMLIAGAVLLVALPVLQFGVLKRGGSKNTATGSPKSVLGTSEQRSNDTPISVPLNQDPPFAVLLPEGKTANDVGGFAKVSPAGNAGAYAFIDKIGDTEVQVTQQQMPESLKANTSAEVEKLAISFNATEAVKTDKLEFFVGTSSKGAQSVITYKKGLLIFLKSAVKISNDKWSRYITDLQ